MRQGGHSAADLRGFGAAACAALQVDFDSACVDRIELPCDVRGQIAGNVPVEHQSFAPSTFFRRSASIRCPRLSRDATVPMEQLRARAICS